MMRSATCNLQPVSFHHKPVAHAPQRDDPYLGIGFQHAAELPDIDVKVAGIEKTVIVPKVKQNPFSLDNGLALEPHKQAE